MEFFKSSSGGNTFLLLEKSGIEGQSDPEALARTLCDPRRGVFADGLVVFDSKSRPVHFQIFNRDGSRAEISGNGMAGLAALLFYQGTFAGQVRLDTPAGPRMVIRKKQLGPASFRLEIEIGNPDFTPGENFPFLKPGTHTHPYRDLRLHPVSVGNPHVVILLPDPRSASDLNELGREISTSALFPHSTNVEFAWDIGDNRCRIHFFERGVGQTAFSATGAAAVFAVLDRQRLIFGPLTPANLNEPVRIFKKDGIFIENSTKILYKCRQP